MLKIFSKTLSGKMRFNKIENFGGKEWVIGQNWL